MPSCTVQFVGTDNQTHTETVEASSLFDAANQAMKRVSQLWWWNPAAPITVQVNGTERRVLPGKVIEWRNAKAKPLS